MQLVQKRDLVVLVETEHSWTDKLDILSNSRMAGGLNTVNSLLN